MMASTELTMNHHSTNTADTSASAIGREDTAAVFCHEQFADLDAEQFPRLPSTTYTPRPSKSFEATIEGLGWDSSAFKPTIFIRLAWAILQAKYTHNQDVLFGAATGINGTAYPNRVRLDYSETVEQALQALQAQSENLAAAVSTTDSKDLSSRQAALDSECDYQTMLVLTSSSTPSVEIAPQMRERRRQSLIDLYALTLECTVSITSLWIRFVFDPAVLSSQQIERMSAQLRHVLSQILMQPQSKVGEIGIACEDDLRDIKGWNSGSLNSEGSSKTVVELLKKATDREALAVDAWDGKFTYAQLDDFSTRLAFHLAALGVGKDTIVPICLEKSKWMSVAILGVVKSGAATLCLNAKHPAGHLRKIMSGRSQVSALLCSESTKDLTSQIADSRPVVVLGENLFATLHIEPVEPLPAIKPEDMLCVLPTTGNSLAVLTHANFAVSIINQSKICSITSKSRLYDLHSYNSSLAYLNHLLSFTNGSCLCVPSDSQRKQSLADSLAEYQASILITTAASAQHIDFTTAVDLETLVVSGEFTPKLELPPHVKLISVYGAPECTIMAMCATEDQMLDRESCLGRGLESKSWVVSTSNPGTLCGVGEVGELLLEGPLVGEGYLKDAEKSRESFMDNVEFSIKDAGSDPSGRIFKTGDLVRYMSDGSIVFVGYREAHVKKVRGKRIDLTEIEGHMKELLGGQVTDVVAQVIAAQGQPEPVLAAFIVPAGDSVLASSQLGQSVVQLAEELARDLKQQLPSHMVPIVFLPLRSVPMDKNGRVDREKLRETAERKSQDPENRTAAHAIRPAQAMTVLEVQLQQLWAQVLGIKDRSSITANSDWITLGGDETSASKLVAAAQNWGLAVSVADVLARTRLADMAECVKHFHRASVVAPEGIDQPSWSDMRRGTFQSSFASDKSGFGGSNSVRNNSTVMKNSMDRRRSSILVNGKEEVPPAPMVLLPLTAIQKRLLQGSIGGHHSPAGTEYYAFDLPPRLEPTKVIEGCRKLVEHFDVLRTVFVQLENSVFQTILPTVDVPIEVHQMSDSLHQASDAFIRRDATTPMKLGRSLLRIYILHKSEEYLRIILRTNQAYTDAQSISTLASALSDVLSGKELRAGPNFHDFIQEINNEAIKSRSYWRNLLLGASMAFVPRAPTSSLASKNFETLSADFWTRRKYQCTNTYDVLPVTPSSPIGQIEPHRHPPGHEVHCGRKQVLTLGVMDALPTYQCT
jgi:non-ribosomal peptide synthetase component F